MAVEAITQVAEDQCRLIHSHGYTIRGLSITSALIIPPEGSVETLFNMLELPTSTKESVTLFEFRVSSVTEDGKWAEHGAGVIGLVEPNKDSQEARSPIRRKKGSNGRSWYAALSTVGVEFGPTFQTLSDISLAPEKNEAIANIALHTTKHIMIAESRYVIHPTTLDGCLQLSVMAAHGTNKLVSKAFLPVFIEELTVWGPSTSDIDTDEAVIYAQGKLHGLRSVHGVAKVFSEDGNMLVNGRVSFLSLEGGLTKSDAVFPRQPYSRLVWKPDLDRLGALSNHSNYSRDTHISPPGLDNLNLTDFIELLAHKGRPLRVFQIGHEQTKSIVDALHGSSPQPIYSCYVVAAHNGSTIEEARKSLHGFKNVEFRVIDIERSLKEQTFDTEAYDLVILSGSHVTKRITIQALTNCKDLLKPNGKLLIDLGISPLLPRDAWAIKLTKAGFTHDPITIQSQSIIISEPTRAFNRATQNHETIWLIYKRVPHPLIKEVIKIGKQCGIPTSAVSLSNVTEVISKGSRIIITAEMEAPLITRMNNDELAAIRHLVKNASSAVWVTNGGLLDGFDPEKSLASGFAKTLMNEQPSFRMSCYDIEPHETNLRRSAALIVDQHIRLLDEKSSEIEMYLVEKNGLVFISRFLPDDVENAAFEQRANPLVKPEKFYHYPSLELDFQRVGQIDSFYYKHKEDGTVSLDLQPDEMLVEPLAYSLSAMEAAILKGQRESEFFSYESIVLIRAIGSKVTGFQPNDRVLTLKPGRFDNLFIVKQESCLKLLPGEKIEDLAGVFVPTCSALHALNNLTRAKKREVILVHLPGDHLLASAFVQVGRHKGLELFITYTSESVKDYFLHVQNMPAHCLISAQSITWTQSLRGSVGVEEVGMIITSTAANNHQDLWKCLKRNGKYLLSGGGSNVSNPSIFDNSVFARGASFISFDILEMLREEEEDVRELLREAFQLYRCGSLSPRAPQSVFDISQLPDAISAVSGKENYGRTILQCGPDSTIPYQGAHRPSSFDSCATFLMIGCLGGLGRSLTNWMARRGARHFVFLSRSGAENPEAAALLKELKLYYQKLDIDTTFQVVRGDVSIRVDVDKAVAAARMPIKGVIHAGAIFQDCLFENMTAEKFHEVLRPKVQGTINLHEALINEPLDFFVMTSSSIGIKGPATQSSYAAANTFMDSMARHRWSLGMQATSLALGMIQDIGHITEHPEIEAGMLRDGLYGIDEPEFLTMMELACRLRDPSSPDLSNYDPYSNAHIITGLEDNRINHTPAFEAVWLQDSRFQHLARKSQGSNTTSLGHNLSTVNILADAFISGGQAAVKTSVMEIILRRFSKLLLIPVEKLEQCMTKPLADLGMDSMISSDVRALAWKEFRADVPFLKILEKGMLLGELVDLVWEKMDVELRHEDA